MKPNKSYCAKVEELIPLSVKIADALTEQKIEGLRAKGNTVDQELIDWHWNRFFHDEMYAQKVARRLIRPIPGKQIGAC